MSASAMAQEMPKKIGYVTNYATHEWYQNVIKGMKDRAGQLGIEFEVRDANLDVAKEVAAAEDFMSQGVDVLIITPVNEEGVVPLVRRAKEEGLPLVLEGNPVKGMTTMVAICDYDTGYHAGVEAGKYAKENLGGVAKVMNVGLPLLSATVLRSQGLHGRPEDRHPGRHAWSMTSMAAAIRTARSKSRPPRSPRTATSTSSTASTTRPRRAVCRRGRPPASRRTACWSSAPAAKASASST